MLRIEIAVADQPEICIPIEQLNMDAAQLQLTPTPPEQLATFFGQHVVTNVAPVAIQMINTVNTHHQSKYRRIVLVAVAAVTVLAGGGFLSWGAIDIGDGKEEEEDIVLIIVGATSIAATAALITGTIVYSIYKCR